MKVIKISAMWCPACILSNRIWKKIVKDNPDIEIEELDYDFDEEKVKKYQVGEILPVVIIMKDNSEINRLIGEKTEEEIKKVIEGCR